MTNIDAPAQYDFTKEKDLMQLEAIAESYPYFSLVHLHRLAHTPGYHVEYSEVAGKALVHFPDQLLLQQRIGALQSARIRQQTIDDDLNSAAEPHEPDLITIEENELEEEETISAEEEVKTNNIELTTDNIKFTEPQTHQQEEKVQEKQFRNTEPMIFQPLHTSDYFASQGIRITEIIQPNDKLGKQLKSFTEWLHVMKKIKVDLTEESSGAADKDIISLAEKSNEGENVVTEAMAEAYLSQGKTKKAVKTYKKLSLLHTDKSSYFAAKIAELES